MTWDRKHRRRLATIMAVVLASCAAPQLASAETVPLPGGAATGTGLDDEFYGMSCPSAGSCVAVGFYYEPSGDWQGLIATEAAGSWSGQQASLASLPSVSSTPAATLDGVSCTSVGNCVAVGSYADAGDDYQGLVETETDGSWTAGKLPLAGLPSTATDPEVDLRSIACPSAGSCVAVGDYQDGSGHEQALIATESSGSWTAHRADLSSFSTYSDPYANLVQVSCGSTGNCAAVGSWRDAADNDEGLIETESNGTWSTSRPDLSHLASVASGPEDTLSSVACPAAGSCTVGGHYLDGSAGGGSNLPLLESETGGSWSPASEAPLPNNASTTASTQYAYVDAIACASSGNCTAVGDYRAAGATVDTEGFGVTATSGTWGSATQFSLPPGAAQNPYTYPGSIACTAPGSCVVGGVYADSNGNYDVLIARLSTGSWTTASIPQPTVSGLFPVAYASVSCAPGGYCGLAGGTLSWQAPTHNLAYLYDAPAAPASPSATVSGTSAQIGWTAPSDTGGLAVIGYTVTASDLTDGARGGQSASVGSPGASIGGLTPGDTYSFTITPISALGEGLPVTTASVNVPYPAPPTPPHPTPPLTVPYSTQQLTAALSSLLAPVGSASRLKQLERTHSFTFKWTPLEAGTVTVRWYAKTGKRKHLKRRLIASGAATATSTAAISVRVTLNGRGKRLVKHGKRFRVTATIRFVSGTTSVSATHTFTLH